MIRLYKPKQRDLWFRKLLLADEETMSYNRHWGGTVAFLEENWADWYNYWLIHHEGKRYYRFLRNGNGEFVGEIAYHYDEEVRGCIANVIIYAPFRRRGYGQEALTKLCRAAKIHGYPVIYDNIALDNPAVSLFLCNGFVEEYRTDEIIMLKKQL